jgi:hypothetical protein
MMALPLMRAAASTMRGVALGPIRGVHGVEVHPPVADMDLQPVAIVLEFMHPALAMRRLLGDSRTAGMDESGGRVWPTA